MCSPVRSVLAFRRETHRMILETQLLEKLWILETLLRGLEDLLEHQFVPQLKMIGERRKGDVAIERREFTQLRRHQDAPLLIDQDIMRAADVEQFERAQLRIEARLLANLLL